ncbi:uncharacterized protein LOC131682013 [Topomyia yanbarensis]|uniref:uncharacterized protein LOC131682013 n=1 Tax=Topomyia yanbarensis TaxID=2498891 RepID=UPI00273AAF3B|nr:uncharacterized protein LOC131682013 [Topomyia yanbarensis]
MKVVQLSVFFTIVLLQLGYGQDVPPLPEGSGFNDQQNSTPSLTDDYVNCPPGDADNPELSMMGDAETDDPNYNYDYDDIFIVPKVADVEREDARSVENATVEESLESLSDRLQETVFVSEPTAIDDSDGSGEVDEDFGTYALIKSPRIYSLPDSEPLVARVAAFTDEHPEEIVLTSPNYPQPYPNMVNSFENFTVTGGIGVQVTIHKIDLDHVSDFLYIRGGSINDNDEKGPVLTGNITEPIRFLIPHTTTFSVHFVSQHNETDSQTHAGFLLTYAPFGTVVSPTTPSTTEMIVPREELQWLRKEISISRTMLVSVETWPIIKTALVNASNAFIEEHQLKYKASRLEDIRILAQKCPDTWPSYEECVSLEFAVPLRPLAPPIEEEPEGFGVDAKGKLAGKGYIALTTTEVPEVEYELSLANLERMWAEFGAMALAEQGIEVYQMPESESVLLIWIAISLCILAAFIFVLYSIWKIDFFKDYRRISRLSREAPDDDRNELKKKEFDISMFPSPHQIVPSLFPTGDPYNDRGPEAQYAYDNSTMNPWPEEADDLQFNTLHQSFAPRSPHQQQGFEPLSPATPEYSHDIVDFNEGPGSQSPVRNRTNPFLPLSTSSSDGFNQPRS